MNTLRPSQAMRSIGVEEELLLVDPQSGSPLAAVQRALAALDPSQVRQDCDLPPGVGPEVEAEVKQEQIEVVSPPSRTLEELTQVVRDGRALADQAAKAGGARAVALATSVMPTSSHSTVNPRFDEMESRFGLTFTEQLTCGFHVHVSVGSEDEGVAVLDRVRPWLPVMLALSTNSPFWMGDDSGFASYRYQAWIRWPTAGPYAIFGSARQYHRSVQDLLRTGVPLDAGMIYFDARLCSRYPTVEFRISDVCLDAGHAVALAGVARALVDTAALHWCEGRPPDPTPTPILELAMWSASKFGMDGELIDPRLGQPRPSWAAVEALLDHVEDALKRNGDYERVLAAIADLRTDGSGAAQQRAEYARSRSLQSVVANAIEKTHHHTLPRTASLTG